MISWACSRSINSEQGKHPVRQRVSKFAPSQRPLEFAIAVGYVFQFSGRSRDGLDDLVAGRVHLRVKWTPFFRPGVKVVKQALLNKKRSREK